MTIPAILQVKSGVPEALALLVSFLEKVDALPDKNLPALCQVPRVCVDLQVPPSDGGGQVCLEPVPCSRGEEQGFSAFLSKVSIRVGKGRKRERERGKFLKVQEPFHLCLVEGDRERFTTHFFFCLVGGGKVSRGTGEKV